MTKRGGESSTWKFGTGVGGMLIAAVGLALLGSVGAILLGFTGPQAALLALWSGAVVAGVWAVAAHRGKPAEPVDSSTGDDRVIVVQDGEIHRHPVGEIREIEGQQLGIIDLGTEVSRELRDRIGCNMLQRGIPFESGGSLGTACLPIVGAASVMASSLSAGNVFLATANTASLMRIGAGVGSAVLGPGGRIVAQAPFIAAGSAIMPVVAPIMLFTTVSTMMLSARLDHVQFSLDRLAGAVQQLLARELAEDYGIFVSAMARLRDLSEEFDGSRRFSDEMKNRLPLVERDLNVLRQKYDILSTKNVGSVLDAELAVSDIKLFTGLNLADVQVDRLRLRLALQDNPDDAARRVLLLISKIERYEESFKTLLDKNPIKDLQDELQESVDSMGWWTKNVFGRTALKEKQAAIGAIQEKNQVIGETLLANIAGWGEDPTLGKDPGQKQTVVFYREHDGKGELTAYYTSDWQLGSPDQVSEPTHVKG